MRMIEEVVLEGKVSFLLSKGKYSWFGYLFRDFDDDDLVDGIGSITLQDVETRLIQLDPSIQDTMWYV